MGSFAPRFEEDLLIAIPAAATGVIRAGGGVGGG